MVNCLRHNVPLIVQPSQNRRKQKQPSLFNCRILVALLSSTLSIFKSGLERKHGNLRLTLGFRPTNGLASCAKTRVRISKRRDLQCFTSIKSGESRAYNQSESRKEPRPTPWTLMVFERVLSFFRACAQLQSFARPSTYTFPSSPH
jgi:hypothetical protein